MAILPRMPDIQPSFHVPDPGGSLCIPAASNRRWRIHRVFRLFVSVTMGTYSHSHVFSDQSKYQTPPVLRKDLLQDPPIAGCRIFSPQSRSRHRLSMPFLQTNQATACSICHIAGNDVPTIYLHLSGPLFPFMLLLWSPSSIWPRIIFSSTPGLLFLLID